MRNVISSAAVRGRYPEQAFELLSRAHVEARYSPNYVMTSKQPE
ncbi:hypothetical protein [Rhizobium sp. WYJ-E13]|nr:hypothetical protein [Rhizobium sp. WYJ-E13]